MRPVMQKRPRYENRDLLDMCQGAPCMLNFPCCTGGVNPDAPSVPAHPNTQEEGRGLGHKSDDHGAIPGCPSCHYEYDYGTHYTREEKHEFFQNGQRKWRDYQWRNRLVRIAK
jgi:hypothetical protein